MFHPIVYKIVGGAAALGAAGATAAALMEWRRPASDAPSAPRERWSSLLWIAFCCAALAWIAVVCLGESFTYWDDDMFFAALRGARQQYPPAVWPGSGRFFPLAHQEFTLLALLDTSGHLYRFVAAVELLLAVAVALRAVRASGAVSLVVFAGIALSPAVLTSHLGLIFAERNQILLSALMLYGGIRYLERGRPWTVALAATASVLLLFYKEASPALVGGASLWLFLVAVARRRGGEWRRPLVLSILFGIAVVGWAGAYWVMVSGRVETSFLQGRSLPFAVAARVIYTQAWFWALPPALVVRIARRRGDPVLDGLLLGAVLYAVGIAFLGLQFGYYTAPTAFLVWVYVAAAASGWTIWPARIVAVAACAAVVAASVPDASLLLRERKALVAAKAEAARFVVDYFTVRAALLGDAGPLVLHFPAGAYAGGLLGGYINATFGTPVLIGVDEEGGHLRCPGVWGVDCESARPRRPGDLVVTLSPGEADAARSQGLRLLFASGAGPWRVPRYQASVFLVPAPGTSPSPRRAARGGQRERGVSGAAGEGE